MKQRNVWFISEFYWPVENATGHIMTRIIDAFSEHSKVNVITVGNKETAERNPNIRTIRVSDAPGLDKNKLIQRMLKMIVVSFRLFWKILTNVKAGDIVVTVTNPAPILIFLACLEKIRRFKFAIIVHDVFPENMVVSGITKPDSFLYNLTKSVFNFSYRQADKLITCGRDMNLRVQDKLKHPERALFIPNFADTSAITPSPKSENTILRELGISDKFVLLFTGNIGRLQGIDNLCQTMKILKEDHRLHWLFIGDGALAGDIKIFLHDNNIHNVTILPNMARERENDFLNAGDVGISSLQSNIMGTGVPSKTYSYMAAGKPVVAVMDSDSEIAIMINETGAGWTASPSDPQELADLITEIRSRPDEVAAKGIVARTVCEQKFSTNVITQQYTDIFTDMVHS